MTQARASQKEVLTQQRLKRRMFMAWLAPTESERSSNTTKIETNPQPNINPSHQRQKEVLTQQRLKPINRSSNPCASFGQKEVLTQQRLKQKKMCLKQKIHKVRKKF